jgi:hypothetical protein
MPEHVVQKAEGDVPLSEITEAEITRVDGVLGPANGAPVLLMKSLPEPVAKALHAPFTGSHSHPHPAMGS